MMLTNDQEKSKNARLSAEKGMLEINYEVRTTTRKQVVSYGTEKKNPTLDAIYNAPEFAHSTVHMKILADGSAESEMLFDEPTPENALVKHRSLPDPSPRVGKAVMKGNQLYLYDTEGKLTSTRQVPVENFKSLLSEMKAAKDKALANKSLVAKATGQAGMDVDAIMEMAKAKNGRIKDISPSLKEIELDMDQPTRGDEKIPSSFRMKYRLDTKRNLMLGGELFDRKTAKLLSKTIMLYKHRPETNDDIISMVYSEEYRDDEKTGRREKSITTSQYQRFEFINNIH